MYLSHLSLTNFRNFVQLNLDLPEGVVFLVGGNAQGKTSLMEAIYLLAIARSFRADNEHEVVNWHASGEGGFALVTGTVQKQDERLDVYIGYQRVSPSDAPPGGSSQDSRQTPGRRSVGVRKQIRVSRVRRTAADLVGMVNAVLFSADDIELVHGPPSLRRRYLDILMSQLDRSYLKALQRYQRIVHQRNRLLRMLQERRAKEDELAFWDQELIKEGSWIVQRRDGAMSTLGGLCRELQLELTGGAEELTVEYRPSVPLHSQAGTGEDTAQNFAKALEASRKREFQLGSTVVGPHRDDFSLLVDGSDMGTYASRGQARTIALTLKLAEAAYLGSARADGPIVLLDDVLSELDSFRRDRVLDKSLQYQQVIISATDLEPIQKSHLSDAACYSVEGGHVTRLASPAGSTTSPA